MISEAKITGNLDEAEDEAEASPLINVITLHSIKVYTYMNVVFLLQKLSHIPSVPICRHIFGPGRHEGRRNFTIASFVGD